MAEVIAMYMVVDVKTTMAWCYCLLYFIFILLADVIANIFVADVITTLQHKKMADVIARWQME